MVNSSQCVHHCIKCARAVWHWLTKKSVLFMQLILEASNVIVDSSFSGPENEDSHWADSLYAKSCQRCRGMVRNDDYELMRGVATTFVHTCKIWLIILDMYMPLYHWQWIWVIGQIMSGFYGGMLPKENFEIYDFWDCLWWLLRSLLSLSLYKLADFVTCSITELSTSEPLPIYPFQWTIDL